MKLVTQNPCHYNSIQTLAEIAHSETARIKRSCALTDAFFFLLLVARNMFLRRRITTVGL